MNLKPTHRSPTLISWRILFFHLIGCLLFIMAAQQFSLLQDPDLTRAANSPEPLEAIKHLSGDGTLGERFTSSALWTARARFIGLIVAGIISFVFTRLKNISWVYTLVALVFTILISWTGVLHSQFVVFIFLSPGRLFHDFDIQYRCLANGITLTALGLFLFIYKWKEMFFFKPENVLE
jgi:ABC-type glycerol-3-phosphate transport system permease component